MCVVQPRQLKSTDVVDGLEDVVVQVVNLGGLLVDLPRGQLAHPRDLCQLL